MRYAPIHPTTRRVEKKATPTSQKRTICGRCSLANATTVAARSSHVMLVGAATVSVGSAVDSAAAIGCVISAGVVSSMTGSTGVKLLLYVRTVVAAPRKRRATKAAQEAK